MLQIQNTVLNIWLKQCYIIVAPIFITYGFQDKMQFKVLFKSISVVSERCGVIMKGSVQQNPLYGWKELISQGKANQGIKSVYGSLLSRFNL